MYYIFGYTLIKAFPDNNIARQCLYISENLALSNDQSLMNLIKTRLIKYNHTTSTSFSITKQKSQLIKTICFHSLFEYRDSKAHQIKLIRMNTKLNFYSKFINYTNGSDCYDLVKNMRHRRILAKFRVGKHNLQIKKR